VSHPALSVEGGLAADERPRRLAVRVPTRLDAIEAAVDVVARHCLRGGLPAQRARFNLRVALCEALANAIVYGNALNPDKWVDVEVTADDEHFLVRVADEGTGFDPAGVPEPHLPDDIECDSGRGLFLIRRLVDAVSFNDEGNAICMVLRRA
jgi:anti-sigma regulatory factor (Ser/Thr protein kinase)